MRNIEQYVYNNISIDLWNYYIKDASTYLYKIQEYAANVEYYGAANAITDINFGTHPTYAGVLKINNYLCDVVPKLCNCTILQIRYAKPVSYVLDAANQMDQSISVNAAYTSELLHTVSSLRINQSLCPAGMQTRWSMRLDMKWLYRHENGRDTSRSIGINDQTCSDHDFLNEYVTIQNQLHGTTKPIRPWWIMLRIVKSSCMKPSRIKPVLVNNVNKRFSGRVQVFLEVPQHGSSELYDMGTVPKRGMEIICQTYCNVIFLFDRVPSDKYPVSWSGYDGKYYPISSSAKSSNFTTSIRKIEIAKIGKR